MDERLPAAARPDIARTTSPPWRRFLRGLWTDIQAARAHRSTSIGPTRRLLAPQQQFFLRENLQAAASVGAIRFSVSRPRQLPRPISTAADTWLKQYFDTRSKSVQVVQGMLKQVAGDDMAPELPDLTGSLEALRVLQLAQDKRQPLDADVGADQR